MGRKEEDEAAEKEFWEQSAQNAKEIKAIHEHSDDKRLKGKQSSSATSNALPEESIELVNYNNEIMPASELQAYHQHVVKTWTTAVIFLSIVLVLFGIFRFHYSLSITAIVIGVVIVRRKTNSQMQDWAWDTERKRGTLQKKSAFESVEWLNSFLRVVWPILDPDLFVAGVDLLEDALKMLSPSIVRTVRIDSVEQGTNSIRILGIRRLPEDFDITESPFASHINPTLPKEKTTRLPDNSEPGQFMNIEAEFAYRRLPKSTSDNAHFVVYMGIGVKKLVKVELPVLVELSGLHGKIRLRLEMIAEPPFVRHVKFSFPTFPTIDIVAKPLRAIDVMTLPGFKPFILSSINSVLFHFVAPQSYELDLSRFVLGSDVEMKTRSVGVVCIAVHKAQGLMASDVRGTSDPFVQISFAHSGKVLYTTRVAPKTLNPVWEELAFLQVTHDEIDEQDRIRFSVVDYDRFSRNDTLGSVSVSLTHLVDNPGAWDRDSIGLDNSAGTVSYSAAFFPLANMVAPNPILNADPTAKVKATKAKKNFTDRTQPSEESRSSAYAQRMREMLDGRLPANRSQPTGILAFQVHQLSDLEIHEDRGDKKKTTHAPSSYCNVFVNGEKLFQTRIKPLSAQPYFNAGSETICKDWTRARIDFAVMDYRDREADVLIGFVSLQLGETFSVRSQITKWIPLIGGNGHGRLRISLLFKPLDIVVPKPLMEWSIGTFEFSKARLSGLREEVTARLVISADGQGSATTHPTDSLPLRPDCETTELYFEMSDSMKIPILSRLAPLVFKVQSHRALRSSEELWAAPFYLTSYTFEGEEQIELTLRTPDKMRKPDPVTLPYQPRYKKDKIKLPKEQDKQPGQVPKNSSPSSSRSSSPTRPLANRAESTRSSHIDTHPTLYITLKWKPGLSASHRDIIMDQSAAARAAFSLWLHRHDFAVKEKKRGDKDRSREDPDASASLASELTNRSYDLDGSSDDEELGSDFEGTHSRTSSVDALKRKMKSGKEGKGATMKWIGNNLKLAGHKVRKVGGGSKSVSGPIPETEVTSSF